MSPSNSDDGLKVPRNPEEEAVDMTEEGHGRGNEKDKAAAYSSANALDLTGGREETHKAGVEHQEVPAREPEHLSHIGEVDCVEPARNAAQASLAEQASCSGQAAETQRGASFLPERNADYLQMHYWDKRFEQEEEYEWFKSYKDFRHLMLRHVGPTDRVLVVGCGNSRLSEHLYLDGITQITSTDLSAVAVERMRKRCATNKCSAIQWEVADMLDLPFPANSFDVVIEKGAMDVLFVDNESPWAPSPVVRQRVRSMLTEAHRVLAPQGLFVSITFGQPHFRKPLFEDEGLTWAMQYETFGEAFHYFFYILRKGTRDPSQEGPICFSPGHWHENMEHENMDSEDYLLNTCLPEC